jgi:hypothetical protein
MDHSNVTFLKIVLLRGTVVDPDPGQKISEKLKKVQYFTIFDDLLYLFNIFFQIATNVQVGYGSLIIWPPGSGSTVQDYGRGQRIRKKYLRIHSTA